MQPKSSRRYESPLAKRKDWQAQHERNHRPCWSVCLQHWHEQEGPANHDRIHRSKRRVLRHALHSTECRNPQRVWFQRKRFLCTVLARRGPSGQPEMVGRPPQAFGHRLKATPKGK